MKKFLVGVVVLVMILSVCACGGDGNSGDGSDNVNTAVASIDNAGDCAQYIKENVEFEDTMDLVDKDIVLEVYGIDSDIVSDVCGYFSTGATAEEIVVFTASEEGEEDKVDALNQACNNRVAAQRESFENYVPEELTKLEKPLILETENSVVMVICNDAEKANDAVLEYIGD